MPDRTHNYDKSPKGQQYRNEYRRDHYKSITVLAPPDIADEIAKAAEASGQTKTQYILTAVKAYMEKGTE